MKDTKKIMGTQNTQRLEDFYKNPFGNYNANVLKVDQILDYWCNPFYVFDKFADISESDIYKEANPLVFMGGRGSGKTMFLRYWTYEVQKKDYFNKESNLRGFLDYLNSKGGVATYIRIDGPILRSFAGYDLTNEKWKFIFSHYFEIIVARAFLSIISDLVKEGLISQNVSVFEAKVSKLLGCSEAKTIDEFVNELDERINEVTLFRGEIALFEAQFSPTKAFPAQSLSFELPKVIKNTFKEFDEDFNFVIIIDEYENFLIQQQECINTLLKFVNTGITFRVGMRLEGFRTFDTISTDDFIKEGRDYRKIILEDILNLRENGYHNYLKQIATKRLQQVPCFKDLNKTDITEILGFREDLENEALELTQNNPYKHFDFYKSELPTDAKKKLRHKENPLFELLGIIYVTRGYDIDEISDAYKKKLKGIETGLMKKMRYDYTNKYKYSLMILLSSIYRRNKMYYSFNTFSYLSSGIVGHFIELCRRSFQIAEFENRESLIKDATISKEYQAKAAREYSTSELQQIKRIEDYGNQLYQMTENLGNVFREYHKDPYIRYPETNQFTIDKSLLEGTCGAAFDSAIKWSVIIRKPSLQAATPGAGRKEIFALNRIFSPEFQISYRTRGGYNEEYNSADIEIIMNSNNFKTKKVLGKSKTKKANNNQTTLDLFGDETTNI